MGKFRIYPDRGNTLIENSQINTGLNEVFELWYGNSGVARHLIHFDFTDYNEKYLSGEVPHITATTAIFHLEPCYPFFEREPYADAYVAESSIIDVMVVQQNWDTGVGHDFYGKDVVRGVSNWYSATSTSDWALHGGDFLYTVFSGVVNNGNESLDIPATREIEFLNTFTGNNYGLVIKFNDDVEALTGSSKHILKYFSSEAFTRYRAPYIELTWDDKVTDQRDSISAGVNRRLYLYVKKNGVFSNVNDISGVTTSFSNSGITSITTTSINNPMRGIYYIDITYPSTGSTGVTFTDRWSVQYESGMTYSIVSQTGITTSITSVWTSSESINSERYTLAVPNMLEKYTRGDVVYLEIDCYTPFTSNLNIVKNLEYKIDLIDGTVEFPFMDWEDVSYSTSENFIILDTSWLLDGYKYALTVRYKVDGSISSEVITKKFWIV